MNSRLAAAFFVCLAALHVYASGLEIHGTVTDARDGHPVRHAKVTVSGSDLQAICSDQGTFHLLTLPPATYTLQFSAPGYRNTSVRIELKNSHGMNVAVKLVPSQFARVDSVLVAASGQLNSENLPYRSQSLSAAETKNLAGVLADDPMRAVQALPGVTSNDDFEARFSLRGEDFSRIGIYLDGVLLHDALHSLQGTDLSGSASVFNSSLIQGMDLYEDMRPERLADTSGAALDVHMREGDHDHYSFQVNANLAGAGFSAGGPLGGVNRCSWIAGFRKTYIQYILARFLTDPSLAFGLTDGTGQLTCLVNARNSLSLEVIDSYTGLNRTAVKQKLGANDVLLVAQHAAETNLSWTYAPDEKTEFVSDAAWMDDRFSATNPANEPLGHGSYNEWALSSGAIHSFNSSESLSVGGNFRLIHDGGFEETYDTVRALELLDLYHGSDVLASGYIEDSWAPFPNRLRLTAGGRWDHDSLDGVSSYSPQAGVVLHLFGPVHMETGWGQYVQYPTVSVFGSNLGSASLLPSRSTQASVALESRFLSNTTGRVEFYDRQDRDLLFQPYADPRVVDNVVFIPPLDPQFRNSLRGYGRGFEASLRRSISSGFTGWLSYSYGRSRVRDGVTGDTFPSDYDQRHTINAYASYRVRPSVNLSSRWTYGSGFPASGFLTAIGPPALEDFYLIDRRNTLRIGPYQRLDLRMNKTWSNGARNTTLYVEVANATNKANYRFGSLDGYNTVTKTAFVTVDQMFPILPSAGVVFAW